VAITLGIDLAAAPERTGVCVVTWNDDDCVAEVLAGPHDDERLLALMSRRWDKIGIDVPLGWPEPFVDAVTAHRKFQPWPEVAASAAEHRRLLRYRLTDLVLAGMDGLAPLSVSTDLIGVVALRAALLLDRCATTGKSVRRDGLGPVAEVYPAAALRRWAPEVKGSYKRRGNREPLGTLVAAICEAVPITFAGDAYERCLDSHDTFDALVCALVARAVTLGQTRPPRSDLEIRRAATEGWIHVPEPGCTLPGLLSGRG
jgi:predicted nuclease with RNAse H fold